MQLTHCNVHGSRATIRTDSNDVSPALISVSKFKLQPLQNRCSSCARPHACVRHQSNFRVDLQLHVPQPAHRKYDLKLQLHLGWLASTHFSSLKGEQLKACLRRLSITVAEHDLWMSAVREEQVHQCSKLASFNRPYSALKFGNQNII